VRAGVTRRPLAAPLLTFLPSEDFTPRAWASCFHKASSHGLQFDLTEPRHPKVKRPRPEDRVFVYEKTQTNGGDKLALQSIKEPEDWLVSFENYRPP
jgi:hypothetical protein